MGTKVGMLRDNLSQRESRHQGSKPGVQWVVGVIKKSILKSPRSGVCNT